MARRETLIARSIVYSLLTANRDGEPKRHPSLLARIFGLFNLYWLTFQLVREDLFSALRDFWAIRDEDYKASFDSESKYDRNKKIDSLHAMGDMGYSGSTFYRTSDSAYVVKSVPRRFEHMFFKNDMLLPYVDHMHAEPSSLLVRITDFLECTQKSIGTLLGLAPSHHIVMENILYGQDQYSDEGPQAKWESWDLKPTSYFYPERDVVGGALASEATKSRLADKFDDKVYLSLNDAEDFKAQLEKDTKLLANCNAVDYSLFLVRVSAEVAPDSEAQPDLQSGETSSQPVPPAQPPFAPPGLPTWRTGIKSSDGKSVYRAAILDFFWAKHTAHAKAMTGLIESYNVIDEQGPMSVTTTSSEYRERFLRMCREMVEVERGWNGQGQVEEQGEENGDS
ncbi:phosphatidylinositol-4-phosphate 5-kinase-domain-containing protein [Pseudomassariella vexata]|uniref:Phosphatidylinositol-4-phosphate 5-kinase-domain-containing protein n=1 Tax=Pseudomassariella vexata TaxID=1141098 RepID=A0A1Y2DNW3_9PEZI|nr:phosphatidylinositol-4-phosphate 5-kinase-domain-containing protein [Pseudomassariella vexata]ORY60854.1 phosphatidylinositol-4-phosphate 5-kinase-domain-containing protein [Pseudomassariella vexata]